MSLGWRGRTRAVSLLVVVAAAVVLQGCQAGEHSAPERPAGVPASAVWVGGADGGVFVAIRRGAESTPGIYDAEIYFDGGDLWYRGRVQLEPPGGEPVATDDASALSAWDGESLHLADGRTMRALDTQPEE